MNATIAALIEKHLNATLTASEAAMLAHAMAESPALADEFAAATRMEADLSASMKDGARTALYTRRMERAAAETEPAHTRRQWPVKTMATAAGIAVLAGVAWRIMEVETVTSAPAKKSSPSLPQYYSGGPASFSADSRAADASALKSKLRRFASSTSNLRSVPVSQALAALQTEWKDYAHGNAKDKEVAFTIADPVKNEWLKPEDEPTVSLEIPGISLLTSLELVAAQAGLKTAVTAGGVSFEPPARKDDGKERTWTIPLSFDSVTTFMRAVSLDGDRTIATISQKGGLMGPRSGLVGAYRPSWMQVPELAQALNWSNYSSSGTIDGGVVTWDDSISTASVDQGSDGYTIDLNLAPEVIEFEGFINYGEPIQTTGINALGQSEPVILTDSKITQPVFATRLLLDHPANLSRLLAAHGMPEENITWDQENGIVTASGPLSQLRAAHAAVAAIEEAASAGVTVEMKVIEWKNGASPAMKPVELLPPANQSGCITINADAAAALLREPGAILRSSAHSVPAVCEDHDLNDGTASVETPDGSLMPRGARVRVTGVRRAGMALESSVIITYPVVRGNEIIEIKSWPTRFPASSSSRYRLEEGDWLQFDVSPEQGETRAVTILVGVRPAAVP